MLRLFKKSWSGYIYPMIRRPPRIQVAALCYRDGAGGKEVLLVTSLTTQRWIIPKGWPMRGRESFEAARQEAWEEAGVMDATPTPQMIGSYHYDKIKSGGWPQPVEVHVFPFAVKGLADDYPEAGARQREWFTPEEAAALVDEPGLKDILARF